MPKQNPKQNTAMDIDTPNSHTAMDVLQSIFICQDKS